MWRLVGLSARARPAVHIHTGHSISRCHPMLLLDLIEPTRRRSFVMFQTAAYPWVGRDGARSSCGTAGSPCRLWSGFPRSARLWPARALPLVGGCHPWTGSSGGPYCNHAEGSTARPSRRGRARRGSASRAPWLLADGTHAARIGASGAPRERRPCPPAAQGPAPEVGRTACASGAARDNPFIRAGRTRRRVSPRQVSPILVFSGGPRSSPPAPPRPPGDVCLATSRPR